MWEVTHAVGVQGLGKMTKEERSGVFPPLECPSHMASEDAGDHGCEAMPMVQLPQLRGTGVHRGGQGWVSRLCLGPEASSTQAQAQLHLLTCCPLTPVAEHQQRWKA